jgi:ribosomal protein S21
MWDFTLKSNKDEKALKKILREISKKWVFQEEKGKSGYEHYQGRISLKQKRSASSLITFLKNYPELAGVHLSPTSGEVAKTNNFNYVMKDDTRISGPWRDTDIEAVLTKQMELLNRWGLRPWQIKLKEMAKQFDLRKIDIIYDEAGNSGKSLFSEHMEYEGLAEEVPPYRMMDDIFQWVCTRPIKPAYIFDMPRGMKKDKLADFYSGIEVIKNGVAFDKRYSAKKIRMDRPAVFVFTNMLPQFDLMSKDKWTVWTIKNKELVPYDAWDYDDTS